MPTPPPRRAPPRERSDQTYLAGPQPQVRRETSDERRARQKDEVSHEQADLKREAAERREGRAPSRD